MGLVSSYKGPQRASLLPRGDMKKVAQCEPGSWFSQALGPPAPGSCSPVSRTTREPCLPLVSLLAYGILYSDSNG